MWERTSTSTNSLGEKLKSNPTKETEQERSHMRVCGRSLKVTPHHDVGTHEILSFFMRKWQREKEIRRVTRIFLPWLKAYLNATF